MAQLVAADGQVAGAGFLCSGDMVITCAHVVDAAGSAPGGRVGLRFPRLPDRPLVGGTVLPEVWRAPEGEDIAAVRLDRVPAGSRPVSFGSAEGSSGHRILTFGFPRQAHAAGHFGYGTAADLLPGGVTGTLLQLTNANDLTTGFSGGPVMDEVTGLVIGMVTSIAGEDPRMRGLGIGYATPAEVLRAAIPGLVEHEVLPYPGLAPFTERDARWFHGRRTMVHDVLEGLRHHRLVLVLGPSGAGKSSFVQAGVLPALSDGELPGSDRWVRILARPGRDLPAELERSGLRGAAAEGFGAAVRGCLATESANRLLVVIDQFEELLTQPPADGQGPGRPLAVVEELVAAIEAHPVLSVLLIMRNDFYPLLAEVFPELLEAARPGALDVSAQLTAAELREIIVRPAQDAGARFEDGLPERIIEDFRAADPRHRTPATLLPPLQLALAELWQRRRNGRITHDAYQRMGEVTGSLTRWCNDALDALPPGHRPTAQRVLTALVRPADDGGGVPATRQRVALARLRVLAHDAEAAGSAPGTVVDEVLAALSRDRVIVTSTRPGLHGGADEPVAELVHDALVRDWNDLRTWMARDHRFQTWLHQVTESYSRHRDTGLPGDLLVGSALGEGLEWARQRGLPPEIAAFVTASERRRRSVQRRAQRTAAAMTVLTLLIAALAVVVYGQGRKAVHAQHRAQSRQLAAQSQTLLDTDPDLASLMAIQAYRTSPTGEARSSLLRAADLRLAHLLTAQGGEVQSVAFSRDGKELAGGGADGRVRLWDAASGRQEGTVPTSYGGQVRSLAFGPDGRTLAVAGDDARVRLWDVAARRWRGDLTTRGGWTWSVAFSPDGILACGGHDGTVLFWDVASGRQWSALGTHHGEVRSVAFSRDGRTLASTSADDSAGGRIRLWDVSTGRQTGSTLTAAGSQITSVAFGPDGSTLAGGGDDGRIRLWDTASGRPTGTTLVHGSQITSIAFNPDGTTLASSGNDGKIRLWDTASRERPGGAFPVPGVSLYAVAFSPDGRLLAGGSRDGTVHLWDTASGRRSEGLLGTVAGPVGSLAFSRDGTTVSAVAEGDGGGLHVWDVRTRKRRDSRLPSLTGFVYAAAFSPDGTALATGGDDGAVRLWDTAEGKQRGAPLLHGKPPWTTVDAVAFSPDGRTLASAGGGTVRLWDVATGRQRGPALSADGGQVPAVAFSPDGTTLAAAVTTAAGGRVRLWDVSTGKQQTDLAGDDKIVSALAFSPDGDTLASIGSAASPDEGSAASAGSAIRLWDTATGQQRAELTSHSGTASAVAYSPDGKILAGASITADPDGGSVASAVRLWDAALPGPGQAVGAICRALHRDVTDAERSRYLAGSPGGPVCPQTG